MEEQQINKFYPVVEGVIMSEELAELIERAKERVVSKNEREIQRRSFAYGNTHFENTEITRQTIDLEAEKLAASYDKKD